MISFKYTGWLILMIAVILAGSTSVWAQQQLKPVKDINVELQGYTQDSIIYANGFVAWHYPEDTENLFGFNIYVAEGDPKSHNEFHLLGTASLDNDSINLGKGQFVFRFNNLTGVKNGWTFTVAAVTNDALESTNNAYGYAEIKGSHVPVTLKFKNNPNPNAIVKEVYDYEPQVEVSDNNAVISYKLDNAPKGTTFDAATGKITWIPESHGIYPFSLTALASLNGEYVAVANQSWNVMIFECKDPAMVTGKVIDEEGNPIKVGFAYIYSNGQDSNTYGTKFFATARFQDGTINFPPLDKGEYFIQVEGYSEKGGKNYYTNWYENGMNYDNAKPLIVDCGDTLEISFTMQEVPEPNYYVVTGKVVDAETMEGVKFASVGFLGTNPHSGRTEQFYTQVSHDGTYVITLPDHLEYIAVAQGYGIKGNDTMPTLKYFPQYYDKTENPTDAKKIVLTANLDGVDFYLNAIPVYENQITGSVTDVDDNPLTDLHVAAFLVETKDGDMRYLYSGESSNVDDYGMFKIENLIPGEYVIMAFPHDKMVAPGFYKEGEVATMTWEDATRVTVEEAGISGPYKIVLANTEKINGKCRIRGGVGKKHGAIKTGDEVQGLDGLAGASIYLVNSKNNVTQTMTTDDAGKFDMGNIAAGKYSLVIDKVGYSSNISDITVGDDTVIEKDFTLESKTVSGVNDQVSSFDVTVYPNPAVEMININIPVEITTASVSLVNLNGTVLFSSKNVTNGSLSINTNLVPAGLYFVKVQSGDVVTLKSVVVVK